MMGVLEPASKRSLERSCLKALPLAKMPVWLVKVDYIHPTCFLVGVATTLLSTKLILNKTWWKDGEWAKQDSFKYRSG